MDASDYVRTKLALQVPSRARVNPGTGRLQRTLLFMDDYSNSDVPVTSACASWPRLRGRESIGGGVTEIGA